MAKARVTAKQKSARRKNIAIARKARKKGSKPINRNVQKHVGNVKKAKAAWAAGYKAARKRGFDKHYGAKNIAAKMAMKHSKSYARKTLRHVRTMDADYRGGKVKKGAIRTHMKYLKSRSLKGLIRDEGI